MPIQGASIEGGGADDDDARPFTAAELSDKLRAYDALISVTLTPLLRARCASLAAASRSRAEAVERAAQVALLLGAVAGPAAEGAVAAPPATGNAVALAETLVDLGAGYHYCARVARYEPLIVCIGAGVALEFAPHDALAFVRREAARAADDEAHLAAATERVAHDLITATGAVRALRTA